MADEDSGAFLSYAEVHRISDGVADALRAQQGKVGEWVSLANESIMGKLVGLLGMLKAGISIPARYVTFILWIGELVASGQPKTLLLNKGAVLETSECTPACSDSMQHGRGGDRRSPRSYAPRAVQRLHVIDSDGCSEHIELATSAAAVDPRLAVPVLEASSRSRMPAIPGPSSPALARSSCHLPVSVPASGNAGARPEGRANESLHAPVLARVCDLTRAEMAVARLVAEGLTNKEIADLLVLSVHTVGTHVRSSFTKLNVTNRVALTREILLYDCAQRSASGLG
ncbi:LuxR C-terminal-related transcriptional regulator [Saccharopolyspora indica]|uniref:helix-turn-helix transcriptional regulator n=1 Tax=Saccharopolyspora indica TaxID=1229659 RepID=UPI0022EAC8AC|nr:LuxR C-terminal-related transcriptional regulator [Saccharopolyspora indica]MDA3644137.1 LuxR C-terminal-related transcriptional regulator [Saccharopolyspora indica]